MVLGLLAALTAIFGVMHMNSETSQIAAAAGRGDEMGQTYVIWGVMLVCTALFSHFYPDPK